MNTKKTAFSIVDGISNGRNARFTAVASQARLCRVIERHAA
jgi:hypothetical protein